MFDKKVNLLRNLVLHTINYSNTKAFNGVLGRLWGGGGAGGNRVNANPWLVATTLAVAAAALVLAVAVLTRIQHWSHC